MKLVCAVSKKLEFATMHPVLIGHLLAIFTIFAQSGRLSSTKSLLSDFSASQILFTTLLIAYISFIPLSRKIPFVSFKKEMLFIVAGLFGTSLYFFTTNLALNYTSASNASLLLPCNVIITAILGFLFLGRKLSIFTFLGFFVALSGIFLVMFGKEFFATHTLHFASGELVGDVLCLVSALFWSIYALILEKIFRDFKSYSSLSIIRRIFFYGVIFNFLFLGFGSNSLELSSLYSRVLHGYNLFNLLFLGIVVFAVSFLAWGVALKNLGALKVSAYFYVAPVLSVLIANITLGEHITIYLIIGGFLTLLGAFLSHK